MWSQAPELLSLSSGEVHVWRARLGAVTPPENFLRVMHDDERVRASRFHFERDRRRFILGRGFLRSLLAGYLGTAPEEVSFSYGPYGKPALGGPHAGSLLRFNASHSHELALYAFTQEHEVGIDVEHVNKDFASEDIARRFFSASEFQTLSGLPEEEKAAAFFRCWTRKEAYIKALGSGLSHPLDQFDVTLAAEQPAALLRDQCDAQAAARWSLFNLDPGADYAGALAVQSVSAIRVQRYDCPTP